MNKLQSVFAGMSGAQLSASIAAGGSKYLGGGDHDVRVSGVDRSKIDQDKVTIVYADASGREHKDQLFTTGENKKTGAVELNWKLRDTIGMLLGTDEEVVGAFMGEVVAGNWAVLDLFAGLGGRITLAREKGYSPAQPDPVTNGYVVHNCADPAEVYCGATIEAAQRAAEKAGLRKGYMDVTQRRATNVEANVQAFTAGLRALRTQPAAPRASMGYGAARGAGAI